ncbi:transcriptional regulator, GntR family [Roseovarius pacificus]|uniref:Transcriptional regulator, GntR family n=1 Tax=Roseovarius pacificus TaxID=337701 RepID=A0A1M7BG98_9RHOB|nr:PLP-dependent aminotransferase family protein [Roseovarius pacificus]GGO55066.1 GntR family transcriptional regulator [Roseovarius pacificus]SHL54042.1 transcriptional regulator, GntR family [Roseovarius pacificus]
MSISVETFFLNPNAEGTLQAQIQQMIAQGILSGRFRKGEKLPSSRSLARHLGVSRITVTLAYTELQASDYLEARDRSGYFVSENAPEPPQFDPRPSGTDVIDWSRALGRRFTGGHTPEKPQNWSSYRYPFIYGQADPSLFDHANWRHCALQALGQKDFQALTTDYYDQDDPLLIEFIARHTLPRRGILAQPDEILVTMGAQNALWLTAQVLLTQRRTAAIEEPCYHALRDILMQSRCHLAPVDVDRDGLPPDALPQHADVIFTTPSHQSPTNATMPMDRRKVLLDKAREMDALIVEDDYEFEISFLRAPLPALKSLDTDGRVIYVGSFSKSIFPGLRLGYLVGSRQFIRECRALRASVLRHPPGHIQRTAAYFLSLGHYDSLVRRMGTVFARRRQTMEQALADHGLGIEGRGVFGGSSIWMRAPDSVDTAELDQRLRARSVLIEPGLSFFRGPDAPRNYYRLAYSSIPSERISDGIAILAEELHRQS